MGTTHKQSFPASMQCTTRNVRLFQSAQVKQYPSQQPDNSGAADPQLVAYEYLQVWHGFCSHRAIESSCGRTGIFQASIRAMRKPISHCPSPSRAPRSVFNNDRRQTERNAKCNPFFALELCLALYQSRLETMAMDLNRIHRFPAKLAGPVPSTLQRLFCSRGASSTA